MRHASGGARAADFPRPQRATGSGRFAVMDTNGPRLRKLLQRGSAKVRFTRSAHWNPAENAVLINTAGGVAGGDRFDWGVEVDQNAHCTVTTQACEKAYRSEGETAEVEVRISVANGGRLDWLPQETILFDGARLDRTFTIDLAQDAVLLAVEAVILGRTAMGEAVSTARLRDLWRVRRNNQLIFADTFKLHADVERLKTQTALLRGVGAYALILLLARDVQRHLGALRTILDSAGAETRGGASHFDDKVICRIVAPDGVSLRKTLIPVMTALRDGAAPPRLWSV